MTETEVLNVVEELLKEHQPTGYGIELSRSGVRNDSQWWYVVVHPTKPDVRASEYTRNLEQIENEIAREHGINVLLVPTIED